MGITGTIFRDRCNSCGQERGQQHAKSCDWTGEVGAWSGVRQDLGGGRGLGMYGSPVSDTYGRTDVEVADSSAAMEDCCWLRVEGEAHLSGPPEPIAGIKHGVAPGQISAHLNLERAKAVRDRLSAWIETVEGSA